LSQGSSSPCTILAGWQQQQSTASYLYLICQSLGQQLDFAHRFAAHVGRLVECGRTSTRRQTSSTCIGHSRTTRNLSMGGSIGGKNAPALEINKQHYKKLKYVQYLPSFKSTSLVCTWPFYFSVWSFWPSIQTKNCAS